MKQKLLIFILVFSLPFVLGAVSNMKSIPVIMSIPYYSLNCSNFENGVGLISDNYYCSFYYSSYWNEKITEGCSVFVGDSSSNEIYYNTSFEDSFIITPDKNNSEFYNYTFDKIIPINFSSEGQKNIEFSFKGCSYESLNGVIESKQIQIFSQDSYYYVSKQLEELNSQKIKSSFLTGISIFLAIVSIILPLIIAKYFKQKAEIVDIQDKPLEKIKNILKSKKKK